MALVALDKLGASDEQLLDFYSSYSKILEIQTKSEIEINSKNWRNYLGKHTHNTAYREFFLAELENNGVTKILSTYLPHLIPGLSGGAFHPLIRLAYAVDTNSTWEIADATVKLYLSTQDSFSALYCVTATHALRILEPYLVGKEHLKYLWQSVCA